MNWPGYYDKAMMDSYLYQDCSWAALEERFGTFSIRWLWHADDLVYGRAEG